eukprot:844500-Prorocentrum_minimum.AAC.1
MCARQVELERRLQQEVGMREQMYQAQLAAKEEEIRNNANKEKDSLLQKEAMVLREREQLWRCDTNAHTPGGRGPAVATGTRAALTPVGR